MFGKNSQPIPLRNPSISRYNMYKWVFNLFSNQAKERLSKGFFCFLEEIGYESRYCLLCLDFYFCIDRGDETCLLTEREFMWRLATAATV